MVRAISSKHKEILHENVSCCNGRSIHIFGDDSLSVFTDPVEAVKCSLEIQGLVKEDPIIPMRIALHYVEIITEGEDIFGDAVNLTSRILKVAITNSILISDKVKLLLDNESNIQTRSIGTFDLKYVDERNAKLLVIKA